MRDDILDAATSAVLDVGVVVAVVATVVALLGGHVQRLVGLLARRPALGPAVGALLGLVPGCGGALVVAPLYLTGSVSRGTLVATLVATTGDSAFALWAGAPVTALALHLVLGPLAVACGLASDRWWRSPRPGPGHGGAPRAPLASHAPSQASCASPPSQAPTRPVHRRLHLLAVVPLAGVLAAGVTAPALAVAGAGPVTGSGVAAPGAGVTGTMAMLALGACLVLTLRSRGRVPCETGGALLDRLRTAAVRSAVVVVWVAAAFVLLALLPPVGVWTSPAGGAGGPVVGAALAAVAGVAVGALPTCGAQVAWTGLYLDGGLPLSGLVANAVAQDGDALLPLLAVDRRAVLALTALTTAPALVLGLAVAVVAPGA